MIPVTTFAGKTVAVFGLGASGIATALALMAGGARVAAWDDGAGGRASADKAGITLIDLSVADWSQFAALVLAPGVPLTHPEPHWTVLKAREESEHRKRAGQLPVEVIGDIELFCRERNAHCPDAPFIAVTGTNGKSTTTALIAHILAQAGQDVQMGGNIGVPILALEPPAKDRFHVIEMSSFQIDLTPSVNPTVGVLLNITPDHLDRHGPADDLEAAMRNYAAIKARLVFGSRSVVLPVDFSNTYGLTLKCRNRGQRVLNVCSMSPDIDGVIGHMDGVIFAELGMIASANIAGVSSLRGGHNAQNAVAAFGALIEAGLTVSEIATHIRTYPGLPHRMEEIGSVGPVLFINDSKATNADSTEKALLSFPRDVFWIVGGKAKEGGIEPLRPYFPGIVRAYLIGAASDEFAKTLDGDVAIIPCGTLDVAVARAIADAQAYAAGQPMAVYNVEGSNGAAPSLSSPWRGEEGAVGATAPNATGEGLNPHSTLAAASSPSSAPLRSQCFAQTGHLLPSREKAVKGAAELVIQPAQDAQPVVLLSPACASYDQFANFEKRGEAFRALVTALPGFKPRGSA